MYTLHRGFRKRAGTKTRAVRTVGGLQVGIAGGAVGGGVVTEVEEEGEHLCRVRRSAGRATLTLQRRGRLRHSRLSHSAQPDVDARPKFPQFRVA